MNVPSRSLIVRQPWAGLIVNGHKRWELRTRHTTIRERVGIIAAGTSQIIGSVDLVGSIEVTDDELHDHQMLHLTAAETHKYRHAWILENPERYDPPIKYAHPTGAVTWVRTSKD